MKVSIITVCLNSEKTIEDTFHSVQTQSYPDIEYIVIDGLSIDATCSIIKQYSSLIDVFISENDTGLYDAMNKGLELATGDIIGFLNSDDILADQSTLKDIVEVFNNTSGISGVYGDVNYYDNNDFSIKKRHYSSKSFSKSKFSRGMMPAHPSFYALKMCYVDAGYYKTNYKIAADFDMLLRIFNLPDTSFHYIEKEIVKMRVGGISTSGFFANFLLNKEVLDSCKSNNVNSSWLKILSKYPKKLLALIFK